jgi:hypothetical protein
MALIPIYCSNERCKHFGFVSVETLPRVLTCSSCGLQSLRGPPSPANGDHINQPTEAWRFSYAAA